MTSKKMIVVELTDELLRLINDLKLAVDHKSEYPVHTVSVDKFKPISDEDIERLHKGFEPDDESEALD